MDNKFNEEDKKKFIDFLNAVANHAEFKLNTVQLCEYFKLLAHMQQAILKKIDANIFQVEEVKVYDQEKFEQSQKEDE